MGSIATGLSRHDESGNNSRTLQPVFPPLLARPSSGLGAVAAAPGPFPDAVGFDGGWI